MQSQENVKAVGQQLYSPPGNEGAQTEVVEIDWKGAKTLSSSDSG